MKNFHGILIVTILLTSLLSAQELSRKQLRQSSTDRSADFNYVAKKPGHYTAEDWATVIDSTWDQSLSTVEKLELFDTVCRIIDERFSCFQGLPVNILDSLRQIYRPEIEVGVSHGRFIAILNHFILALKEGHTSVINFEVNLDTPLLAGVPLMVVGGWTDNSHFGATLTPLPDSTLLVTKTLPNHPLGLESGDLVLGYDGIAWKILYKEILAAQLPLFIAYIPGTAESAFTHDMLKNAGMNWHLFDTLDVVKYSSGDTMHYPTASLAGQSGNLLGSEQLEIPGVPFPNINWEGVFWWEDIIEKQNFVSWGIVDDTNIGYIYVYLWAIPDQASGTNIEEEFYQAIDSLMNLHKVEGLIIDQRLNYDGHYIPQRKGYSLLFNSYIETIDFDDRCNATDHFQMCSHFTPDRLAIPGDPKSLFDRPIAVLTGPGAVSAGDIVPLQMTFHPMARLFGKSTSGAFSTTADVPASDGWEMHCSISNGYFVSQPGKYLSRSDSHVDEEIWLTQEDVAKGEDTVVKRAIEWIQNLAHAHDVTLDKLYVNSETDSIKVTTLVENPNEHQMSLTATIRNQDSTITEQLDLYDDGLHGDGTADDNLWGNFYLPTPGKEELYKVSVTTADLTEETSRTLPNVAWFTTIGPLKYSDFSYGIHDTTFAPGNNVTFNILIHNIGLTALATNIHAEIKSPSPMISILEDYNSVNFADIAPGEIQISNKIFACTISEEATPGVSIYLPITIYSNGLPFWSDTMQVDIPTAIADKKLNVPQKYSLLQNYPNPFNPVTMINYQLPMTGDVELSVYNLLGQKVATLVNARKRAGYHQVEWDASGLASGVYYYLLVAGDFREVKKMILLR